MSTDNPIIENDEHLSEDEIGDLCVAIDIAISDHIGDEKVKACCVIESLLACLINAVSSYKINKEDFLEMVATNYDIWNDANIEESSTPNITKAN
jgi:hypothetical protein